MKTPTKPVRNFSKKNTPVKNSGNKSQSSIGNTTVPVRCEVEIMRASLAVLFFMRESGSYAYMAQLIRHLQASSDDTKEDLKLIDISTVLNAEGGLMSYTTPSGKTLNVQGIIIGFDDKADLYRIVEKICDTYSNVTTPYGPKSPPFQAKLGCIKRSEEDSDLRCLSQVVGSYTASKMVCQLHYESLADGTLLDNNDTLAKYFGPDLSIVTVKELLRQEFKEEYGEEVGHGAIATTTKTD